MGLTSPKLTQ